MTFPGYTFAVQRLQKQTNNILDSISTKLAQLAQLIGEVKTNQTNNKNAIVAKLDLILDKLEQTGE